MVGPSWQQVCAMGYEIPGVGVIPGDIVAGICSRFDTRIRRVLLDPASGTTVETGAAGYTPSAAVRRFVTHPGRALPGAGVRAGGAVLRPGPRHSLAAGADRPHQPADAVPPASPDEAPDELVGGDGRRRDRDVDRPVRPAVHHPPGQPPRHPRRLMPALMPALDGAQRNRAVAVRGSCAPARVPRRPHGAPLVGAISGRLATSSTALRSSGQGPAGPVSSATAERHSGWWVDAGNRRPAGVQREARRRRRR